MKQSDTTARFPQPFAAQADGSIVAYPLPTTKQASGRVSLLNGFPLENFTALSAGGVPPSGADFNGLFRTLTEAIRANEAGQIRAFNADYAQQIGGYPQSALVCDPNTPTRLLLSTQDDNKTDPANDTSGAWMSLTDSISALDAAKVNRSGDTMTGDLVITGNGQYGATIFGGKVASTIKGHPENSFLQAQIINGKPAAVLGVQDAQQAWHTWYFNAADGRVTTPSGHTVLEGDDIGNGHITLQNSGTATGKTLATTDDTAALNASKLNRAGDTMSGGLTIAQTADWGFGRGGGQLTLSMSDGGTERFYHQLYHQRNNLTNGVIGLFDDTGDRQWRFIADGSISTPGGLTIPEVSGIGGRVVTQLFRIQNLQNVQFVPFPRAFNAADPVNQIFITLGNGYNMNNATDSEYSVTFIYKPRTTNAGFYINRSGSQFPAAFDVVAYGPM